MGVFWPCILVFFTSHVLRHVIDLYLYVHSHTGMSPNDNTLRKPHTGMCHIPHSHVGFSLEWMCCCTYLFFHEKDIRAYGLSYTTVYHSLNFILYSFYELWPTYWQSNHIQRLQNISLYILILFSLTINTYNSSKYWIFTINITKAIAFSY